MIFKRNWHRYAADFSLMSVNAVAYFALTAAILWGDYEGWFGLIAFSLAAFYGLMAFAALKRSGAHARVAVFALGIASVFLTMAFPLQFSGYSVAIAWAAQGAVTVWMGFYLGRWQTRAFGVAVLCMARGLPLGCVRLLGGCGGIAVLGAAVDAEPRDNLRPYFGSLEVRQAIDYSSAMHLSLTVLWAVYSMGAISAGIVAQSSRIRLAGIGLLAIPVAKLFAFDVFLLDLPYRVVAFITLGCLLLGMGLVYQRYSHAVRGFLFGTRTDAERGGG